MNLAHRIAGPGAVVMGDEMSSADVVSFGFFHGGPTRLLSTGYVGDFAVGANNSEPRELPFTFPGDVALDQLRLSNPSYT